MEEAWRPALDLRIGDTILSAPSGILNLVSKPLGEPGDPKDASADRLALIVEREWEAFNALEEAGRALGAAREALPENGAAVSGRAVEAEAAEYELSGIALEFWFLRARAYLNRAEGRRAETGGYVLLALEAARSIGAWGRKNILDPRARRNFAFMNCLYRTFPMRAILRSSSGGPLRGVFSLLIRLMELSFKGLRVLRLWEPRVRRP